MATKADLQRIGMWLAALRRATSAGQDAVDPETLAEYTIWLAADFPLTVFSAESVKWMAEQSQYFPKWAILKATLTDWLTEHPDRPRIQGSSGDNFLPLWLHQKIMSQCGNQPGPRLQAWLGGKVIER